MQLLQCLIFKEEEKKDLNLLFKSAIFTIGKNTGLKSNMVLGIGKF